MLWRVNRWRFWDLEVKSVGEKPQIGQAEGVGLGNSEKAIESRSKI